VQKSGARGIPKRGMIPVHDRLHAGARYCRHILPNNRLFDKAFQPSQIGIDVHCDYRLISTINLNLNAQKSRKIAGRLWKARDSAAHLSPAIKLLGIAAAHLTGPAFLS